MSLNLRGIIPPLVTPFKADESIDEEAFRKNIHFMISKGVHGVCIGGSTGEGHTLSTQELARLIQIADDEIQGRLPIVAGVIANSTRDAIEKSLAVSKHRVAALQVTPVHYVFKPDDDATYAHFERLTNEVDIPVIIYNVVPWNYLSPGLLNRLMRGLPGVVGVKQSAGDLKLMADLLISIPEDKVVYTAVDALLYPSFALGAHGTIAANPAAVPGVTVALWEAVQAGNHERALEIHQALLRFWNVISADNLPANVKYALTLQGCPGGAPRMPMPAPNAEHKAAIKQELEHVLQFELDVVPG